MLQSACETQHNGNTMAADLLGAVGKCIGKQSVPAVSGAVLVSRTAPSQ